jgi:hypothetical protein
MFRLGVNEMYNRKTWVCSAAWGEGQFWPCGQCEWLQARGTVLPLPEHEVRFNSVQIFMIVAIIFVTMIIAYLYTGIQECSPPLCIHKYINPFYGLFYDAVSNSG